MTRFGFLPEESKIWIRARTTLHPIESESTGVEGFVEVRLDGDGRLDLSVTPKGRIEMSVDQLTSGNPLYDREMRRRVDARRFPTIDGELSAIDGTGGDGRYRFTGDVTFRGVARPVADEMTVESPEPGALSLEGRHTFDIRDFSFEPPRIMMLRVHPDIDVRVRLVARAEE